MTLDELDIMVTNMADMESRIPDSNLDGQEFAESVMKKAEGILESARATGAVTPGQETAMNNMYNGLQRWVRD